MSTWHDEQLPPDETLRVLAGRGPSWRFRLKQTGLWWLGFMLTAIGMLTAICILIEFGYLRGGIVCAICIMCLLIGVAIGARIK